MSKRTLTGLLAACFSIGLVYAEDFDEAQARLDAECEAAREKKLAPERERHIEECVETRQRRDRESCESFFADWGNQAGRRAPLYMDLPEYVKAFEHRRSAGR